MLCGLLWLLSQDPRAGCASRRWFPSAGWPGLQHAECQSGKQPGEGHCPQPPGTAAWPQHCPVSLPSHFTSCLSLLIYAEWAEPLGSMQGTSGLRNQDGDPGNCTWQRTCALRPTSGGALQ
uniref:Uncharacterized protein n=1 Tax=Myotis myotis TaxID=51298 RepID=A0A7J7V3D8_MYOMY|nr:hypothetical protein mMyoMyo1_008436 [Myotis myotis]